jgi:GT2 family glycosyltransferase
MHDRQAECPTYDCDVTVSLVLFCPPPLEVEACIEQILASRRQTQVIVIDNSPTPVPIRSYPADRVSIIVSGANLGYGRAHNHAIALARGRAPFHLIMNTDVVMQGDAIDDMLAFMEAHPDVGLGSPLIHYPDGRLQTQCRLLPSPVNMFARGFFDNSPWNRRMNRRYELQDWSYDRAEDIPFLPGCFMMVRSEVLRIVKGFDERFFLFAEDLDLSRRIYQISRCMFVPTAVIQHELRSRARRNWRIHAYKIANLTRYFNKWGWLRDAERKRINAETQRRIFGSTGYPLREA